MSSQVSPKHAEISDSNFHLKWKQTGFKIHKRELQHISIMKQTIYLITYQLKQPVSVVVIRVTDEAESNKSF